MQAHVQKRIGLPTFDREVRVEIAGYGAMVFRVFLYNPGDLVLERRQDLAIDPLLPGVGVHLPQLVPVLAENHGNSLWRYSHHGSIAHSPHSGLRALQT